MIKIDEKYFEDILFKSLQTEAGCEKLINKGLMIFHSPHFVLYRQFNLKKYGIPDIIRIAFTGEMIRIKIIELKVTEFNLSHLLQIGRYVSCIKNIISETVFLDKRFESDNVDVSAMLIVAGFDSSNEYTWIDSLLNTNIEVYSTEYGLDGMKFKKVLPASWTYTDEDHIRFKSIKKSF
jgi:hypothetical protein